MKQIALITGARSGIGFELAKRLLQEDWKVISLDRSEFLSDEPIIQKAFKNGSLKQYRTDLSDFKKLKLTLNEIKTHEPYLDVIFNNAGSMSGTLQFSPQGREIDFEVNTVAPYIISNELKPLLEKGILKTIINTSSNAALQTKKFIPGQLEKPTSFKKLFGSYASSKLALSLWTNAFAQENINSNIQIRSVDPGPSKTPLSNSSGMPWFVLLLRPFIFSHPNKGANRLYEAAFGKFRKDNGIFIMNGKNTVLPHTELGSTILEMVNSIYNDAFIVPKK